MRKLPTGIQDFTDIRKRGFCYVDKTACIHRLISGSGKPFFLSRPRRFGKSLLCSTLEAIFEGRRELFGEIAGCSALAIDSLEWEWKKHPVIKLDLNAGVYSNGVEALYGVISRELKREAENLNVHLDGNDCINQFANLIEKSCDKTGNEAVVLIDEYDKPLISTIEERSNHEKIRNELKGFYGVLKSYDRYLRFVFLTGVSKFSRVSVFSDLNHLDDISLDPEYADICGITQEELENSFEQEIETVLKNIGKNREEYLDELRRYYNGYRFSRKNLKVYNPFGLLTHFNKGGEFQPYWYETGTPTFLKDLVVSQKLNILNLNNLMITADVFKKFDIDNMKAEPLLYQTGYLTIKNYDDESGFYTLDYPNIEVQTSFANSLLEQCFLPSNETVGALNVRLINSFFKGDIEEAINALHQFFAEIPYDIIKGTENYYETAVHLIFKILGFNCRSEVRIASGRIDALVETKNFVYCFEFKLARKSRKKSSEEAITQIISKEYTLPWQGSGKKIYKIGIVFDHEKRNISDWKYETE